MYTITEFIFLFLGLFIYHSIIRSILCCMYVCVDCGMYELNRTYHSHLLTNKSVFDWEIIWQLFSMRLYVCAVITRQHSMIDSLMEDKYEGWY